MSKTNKEKLPDLNRVPFKTRVRPYLIVAPSLIITIGIMVPFVMAIWYSLTNFSFKLPTHKFIGLTNWVNVLSSGSTWKAIWVTLLYGIASTAVEMALGMGVAMLLNSLNNRFSKIMRVVLIFPLMVAPVTATIVWQLMLNSSAGIVEKLLNVFNVYNFPWASSPKTAMMTVVLIDVWVNTAFVILLVLAGLQSLPKSPFESAKIDGGSNWFNFRNLTLPMLRPSLYIALLFRLMAALQEYAVIYALTKGGPGDALMSLSLTAYQQGFKFQKFGAALPYILILWLIINVVAKEIVKRQRAAQKQAAGLDE
ncbi:carbohydrate ABC transporter permease [Flintibacter faecis]|uniref:Sugar ABC transporter permease n=1 Tax=Flintibacter faecis TaxID=2763047 RepID=A0A8J6M996_9FIRM|nr:sugar ABC transporter permease [Flintibacter faecis]MBC5715905.1 sugar ABC transporter permease [Flintibacter faecis]